MKSIVSSLALMLSLAATAAAADRLSIAAHQAAVTNRPLIVKFGATWCKPCHETDMLYGEQLRSMGVLVHLDVDNDATLIAANSWLGKIPESIPVAIVWEPARENWQPAKVYRGMDGIARFVSEKRPASGATMKIPHTK